MCKLIKKFGLVILLLMSMLSCYGVNLNSTKGTYDKCSVIKVMKDYHKLYGRGWVNYDSLYATILYYCREFDIELAYAMSFFAIESGFTYECKSRYGAVGLGQITKLALKDYNKWYGKSVSFEKLNDNRYYDHNIKVTLGYLRMCWKRYKVIENGVDLVRAYNIGVSNLSDIKNGTSTDYWIDAANKYETKFRLAYNSFLGCKVK